MEFHRIYLFTYYISNSLIYAKQQQKTGKMWCGRKLFDLWHMGYVYNFEDIRVRYMQSKLKVDMKSH